MQQLFEETITIKATREVWLRLWRFFALMHYNGCHSGLFAMSFDGDGADVLKTDPPPPEELRKPAQRIGDAGSEIEIAHTNSYSASGRDFKRARYSLEGNKLYRVTGPSYEDRELVREYG